MLFINETVKTKDLNNINNFFNEYENLEINTVEDKKETTCVSKYISSLVSNQYKKSVNDIENTNFGDKLKKKRSFQQIMQSSFFYGANRFGNNFIA